MDIIFKLTKTGGFENEEDIIRYFEIELPQRDENYFYNTRKIQLISAGDMIYFLYKGSLVAKAIFSGKIKYDSQRDNMFIYGHLLENVTLIKPFISLKSFDELSDILKAKSPYMQLSLEQKDTLEELCKSVSF